MKRKLLLVSLILLHTSLALPQGKLLDPKLRDLLHESLSGELAKEHVIQITRHSRVQGSKQFRDSANYVLNQLRGFGFDDKNAFIESYPSDGKIEYQTWVSPSGFDMDWAELRMIEPYEERIVGYPEIPMSLITYSNPGSATAELVFVGAGTSDSDYEGKNVKDKIVLATGYGGSVHRLAVLKYGAKAVVCFLDDYRAKEYPDMLAYTGMWPRSDELDRVTFGFNLTNRQGTKLRDLLASGKRVVVKAEAKGIGLEPYFMDVVVATIQGSEHGSEEIVFSAHLDHPKESANDNASGSAALMDIARSMTELIKQGRMPRPKRTIRFLWVPEWYGTMAYIDKHPDLRGVELEGEVLANLNMDMVGENLELLHSKLIITRTPDSIPSVLNDVVADMAEMVDGMDIRTPRGSLSQMNYRITPYSGGSDHMMFIDRKIPGVMFSHDPDYTHHTSEDTPDKVDPVELERTEIIAAATALYLANLTEEQAKDLAFLAFANSSKRLAEGMNHARELMRSQSGRSTADYSEALSVLWHKWKVEDEALYTIIHYNGRDSSQAIVAEMRSSLKAQFDRHSKTLEAVAPTMGYATRTAGILELPGGKVPIRRTRGPLDFGLPESKLSEADLEWYRRPGNRLSGDAKFELVNFIDGKRGSAMIRNALSAEFGPIRQEVVDRYLEDLVKIRVLDWYSPMPMRPGVADQ
ncbi:MAG: DUF4910 domain-containing protein [Acidobacteria bacterium]|nr:MAG: DUF4910 domain-containing protein [Acidobacteriota bacterium]REK04086.1 MAG: DUF4910 domain-containing protein [Acidobacteriota bacterium]REK15248.1 MAG: DUF4910 domain-containing protein [Acidobacteriota bacterium]REK46338.1 MAG: DUF4910 domain-containing protein [Acidobacteriota bacterium]